MLSNDFIKKIIPWTISIAMFIEALDATIINTAVPAIARYMSVSPIDLKIALISYLLSLALFIPISGWLADRFGQRNIFASAIAIFTISSMLCGFSSHLWELVVARLIQGFGGALMMPVGRLIVVRSYERHELIAVMNRIITIALIGPSLGPLVGGYITEYFSWRWIFFVNIPFGLVGFIVAWKMIENKKASNLKALDRIGFILFGVGLGLLVFALSALSESDFHAPTIILLFVISLTMLLVYFFHARNSKAPILDMNLLKIRTYRVSVIGSLLTRTGMGGIPFLMPLLFQISFHYSPFTSGILTSPFILGAMVAKRFSTKVFTFFRIKNYLILNTILLGISIITLAAIQADTSLGLIIGIVFINGIITSLEYSAMNPLAYCDLPQEKLSGGTSITSTVQQIAMSFGVAFSALLLKFFGAKTAAYSYLPAVMIHHTFIVLGLFTIVSTISFMFLQSDDGAALYAPKAV